MLAAPATDRSGASGDRAPRADAGKAVVEVRGGPLREARVDCVVEREDDAGRWCWSSDDDDERYLGRGRGTSTGRSWPCRARRRDDRSRSVTRDSVSVVARTAVRPRGAADAARSEAAVCADGRGGPSRSRRVDVVAVAEVVGTRPAEWRGWREPVLRASRGGADRRRAATMSGWRREPRDLTGGRRDMSSTTLLRIESTRATHRSHL